MREKHEPRIQPQQLWKVLLRVAPHLITKDHGDVVCGKVLFLAVIIYAMNTIENIDSVPGTKQAPIYEFIIPTSHTMR